MLPCVNEYLLYPIGLDKLPLQYGFFDELGASANDA